MTFSLETWFLHQKLVLELLPFHLKRQLQHELATLISSDVPSKEIFINEFFVETLVQYLSSTPVSSLEEHLLTGNSVQLGTLIWIEQPFYFKGTNKARREYAAGIKPSYAELYAPLDQFNDVRVIGKYNVQHIYTDSAIDALSGKKRQFILGYIRELTDACIEIRPIVIGTRISKASGLQLPVTSMLQINPEDVDEFRKLKSITRKSATKKLELNRSISEKQIKHWIAEIVGEANIPNDWGGEKSDLYIPLHVKGKRVNAAFLLKGPSKFHPLQVKDLGKNGDQISRLYDEPAQLFIVVHCHYITPEIRKTMNAFSSRNYNLSNYCLIDGVDLRRILKAYEKL